MIFEVPSLRSGYQQSEPANVADVGFRGEEFDKSNQQSGQSYVLIRKVKHTGFGYGHFFNR
jgi:hypothetical protein